MKTRLSVLLVLFTWSWASCAIAAKNEFVMKGATVAPPNTPWAQLLKKYKKIVRKGSEKRVKVKVYLGGTKGDEQSIVRQLLKGSLQYGGVSVGAMSVVVPELDILELPYLFDTYEEADKVLDKVRPLIEEILEKKGFKLVMFSENGFRCFGTKKPVRTPADLKGVAMRSQESPSHLAMYQTLGAAARAIAVSEVLPALNTGNVDGFDNTALFTQAASWHQAIKYFTVSQHIYQPALLVLNKAYYEGLPEALKSVVMPTDRGLEKSGRKGIRALEPLLFDNFKAQKIEVVHLTDAEKAEFKKVTRAAWDARMAKATEMGKKLFAAIQAAKKAQ
ncbi:MAG: TRAP transporter substrate-binding protein DctP [Myxococcota bacterium]|nr:TRAP transporter substrate-binding protein DctP [Myxococcota bacterium]